MVSFVNVWNQYSRISTYANKKILLLFNCSWASFHDLSFYLYVFSWYDKSGLCGWLVTYISISSINHNLAFLVLKEKENREYYSKTVHIQENV